MTEEEVHFAQHLASNDRRVRDKCIVRLRKWLRMRSQTDSSEFSLDGMMKLWKGLFYCMWMSDKPLVQEELAENISSLIQAFFKPSQSYCFVEAFFKTLGRSHDNIDKFRIDKFLMFTRRFFRANLQYLKVHNWEYKHVQKYVSVLSEGVLSPKHDPRNMALGFRLHFFDIFLEELALVAEGQLPRKRAHNFLQPFYEVLAFCKSPMLVEGARDKVFIQLVKLNAAQLGGGEEDKDSEDDEVANGQEFIDDEAEEWNGVDEEEEEGEGDFSDEGDITEQRIRRAERKKHSRNGKDDYDEENSESGEEDEEEGEEEALGNEAELVVLPIDFDMSAIKTSLLEYSHVEGIKAMNRKAITFIVKKIIDLENGVDPFAMPSEDSGSDLELTEEDLKMAAKRLRLLEKRCAEEAENYLIPERDEVDADEDEFEIEGGEEDMDEFDQVFPDVNAPHVNGRSTGGKGDNKKGKKRQRNKGDHMYSDSEEEHMDEIEKDIHAMEYTRPPKVRKKSASIKAKASASAKEMNGSGDHCAKKQNKAKIRTPQKMKKKKKARV